MKHEADIHHRRSIRLPEYDYARPGAYFVTICTHARECLFADEALAAIVERVWREVALGSGPADEFVIMPNHLHGIIWIAESETPVGAQQHRRLFAGEDPSLSSRHGQRDSHVHVAAPLRPTHAQTSARPAQRLAFSRRPVESGSLSAIVRTFKSATAKRINRIRGTPGDALWQRNYYEHIVRDDDDLHRIRQYIRDNPAKWAEDPLNPDVASVGG